MLAKPCFLPKLWNPTKIELWRLLAGCAPLSLTDVRAGGLPQPNQRQHMEEGRLSSGRSTRSRLSGSTTTTTTTFLASWSPVQTPTHLAGRQEMLCTLATSAGRTFSTNGSRALAQSNILSLFFVVAWAFSIYAHPLTVTKWATSQLNFRFPVQWTRPTEKKNYLWSPHLFSHTYEVNNTISINLSGGAQLRNAVLVTSVSPMTRPDLLFLRVYCSPLAQSLSLCLCWRERNKKTKQLSRRKTGIAKETGELTV